MTRSSENVLPNNSAGMFSSSASYYTDFRKPYPDELISLVRERFQLNGGGVLLDVGCGTGQLLIPLSGDFNRVIGVDVSVEMIDFAQQRALECRVGNAEFLTMAGEEIGTLPGEIDLVTFGSAIHWMDIPRTLTAARAIIKPDGGVAILGMRSIWGGESEWEQTVVQVVQKWMGESRRAGSGTFNRPDVTYAETLAEAGFSVFEEGIINAEYTLDLPFIIGHLYTTSYCNRELLGEDVVEFEHELTHSLLDIAPDGKYRWSPGASYIFARRMK